MLGKPFPKLPAWVDSVFAPETYGAQGGGHDDTTAVQAAVNAAQAVNGTVYLSQTYTITAEIVVSGPCTIDGAGANVLNGLEPVWGSDTTATVSPWLSGAVLLQTTAGANGLKITVAGKPVRLRNFGIRFDDSIRFRNTGHGILADPGALSTYKQNGFCCSRWEGVKVYGTDGNHYGFYLINAILNTYIDCASYGGGGFKLETNSGVTWYGNSTLIEPYVVMCAPGTAVGYHLHNTVAGHGTILVTFIRPQTFKFDSIPAGQDLIDAATWLPDVNSIATQGQATFFADDDSFGINVISPDMECMSNTESIRLPPDLTKWFWTGGHCPGSQYDWVTIRGGESRLDSLKIGGVSVPAPASGQVIASSGAFVLSGSLAAVPNLSASLPAGTYKLTAQLRWLQLTDGYAQATFTNNSGTQLTGAPLTLLYAHVAANTQGSSTVSAIVTLGSTTTVQVRAVVAAGTCDIMQDSAGDTYFIWERIG